MSAATQFPAWALDPANLMAGDPACPKCKGHGSLVRTTFVGAGQMDAAANCYVCGGWKLSVEAQRARKATA